MFSPGYFCGRHRDFEALFRNVNLDQFIVRFWYHPDGEPEGSEILMYYKIVGYTLLPIDILLHLIEVEDVEDISDHDALIKQNGVTFCLLSRICGRHGFEIRPIDQYMDDED